MIRPLHPDDAPALYHLFRGSTPLNCDSFEPDPDLGTLRAYADRTDEDHHRLVTVVQGHLAGLGILEQPKKARMAHLGQIRLLMPLDSVESDIGHELLAALIDLADNWLNLRRLEAEAPVGLPALAALLQQFGFEPEGRMRKSVGYGTAFDDEIAFARLRGFSAGEFKMRPPAPTRPKEHDSSIVTRTFVRPMATDDAEALYEIFRAPENCRTTMQLPSQEIWLTRQRVLDPPVGMIRLVAVYDGRVIGMISLNPRRKTCRSHIAGIGMMVHPDFWGQGIGSRLMEEVLDLADRQLDLVRVELQVHTDNAAGIRLYEKFGFVVEGTKRFQTYGAGGWTDTHFMARMK